MPGEDHLARIRKTTPTAIRRAISPRPISTAANCRWLELLPETKTPFWLCGIAYDSKYPQFGHRNVVTGMTLSLFSTVRPVQKLGWGSPDTSFLAAIQCACYPAPSRTPCARDTSCTQPFPSYSSPKKAANPARPNCIPRVDSPLPSTTLCSRTTVANRAVTLVGGLSVMAIYRQQSR